MYVLLFTGRMGSGVQFKSDLSAAWAKRGYQQVGPGAGERIQVIYIARCWYFINKTEKLIQLGRIHVYS